MTVTGFYIGYGCKITINDLLNILDLNIEPPSLDNKKNKCEKFGLQIAKEK
ncbi:putative ORFan [Tupanvirus deep ocean]|uniref:ORFan n=2 Tax=Tupanvirus TaxID=2094720 RepID=A0AC62A7C6_9VIRU|nr:putative ORFan [Tupanvirus deep ocean]QKU33676.1 putative ORFan [Tupanvirus deep ocean]